LQFVEEEAVALRQPLFEFVVFSLQQMVKNLKPSANS
jgi:hypothetical protein